MMRQSLNYAHGGIDMVGQAGAAEAAANHFLQTK